MLSSKTFYKLSAWAGILGPLLFSAVFLFEGSIRSGYDPLRMPISALSTGQRGWIQIVNFVLFGFLLFLFTLGLYKRLPAGQTSRVGIMPLFMISILFLISGPFVMDPVDTPPARMTAHGLIHGLAGGFVFLLMPVIIFLFLKGFSLHPAWRSLWWWTLALGILEASGVLIFIYVSKFPAGLAAWMSLAGLFQRAALIPFLLWVSIFALKMLRTSEQTGSSIELE